MPIRKTLRTVDAALRDADLARKRALDPAFQKRIQSDRRGTLREFRTVEHAIRDRERIERGKSETPKRRPEPKAKKPSAVAKVARTIDRALLDADAARRQARDPRFAKAVQADRRATLSGFRTVRDALRDRERIEKAKAKRT